MTFCVKGQLIITIVSTHVQLLVVMIIITMTFINVHMYCTAIGGDDYNNDDFYQCTHVQLLVVMIIMTMAFIKIMMI